MRWLFVASLAGVAVLFALIARSRFAGERHGGDGAGTAAGVTGGQP
ncbi:MAG: hypothetical protein KJ048_10390 [Dehalococcoidia bacterium]|nr:hypothetical protein [Dehalococcoidia bacterium]